MELRSKVAVEIRFSEVDSMGIVWHGNYALYFEDAREKFGREHSLEYLYIFEHGFYAPLVELHFDYKKPLKYRDVVTIEIALRDTKAAKLIFDYEIYSSDNELLATGYSIQVFLDMNNQLMWELPEFMLKWKKDRGLI